MKQYNVSGLNFIEQMDKFVVSNLTAISQSISSMLTQIRSNRASIATNVTDIATNSTDIATNVTDIATNTANISNGMTGFDQSKLFDYATKMKNGDTVNVVVYGDSTVDGNNTTGWSANPTSGGEAVGTTDHNLTSPNGWPVKLRTTLRDMFGNVNIQVSNCGYSGQRMDNGWAYDNYDAATTYPRVTWGTPEVALIGFGINDAEIVGADVDTHMAELHKLVYKLVGEGTTPVILSTDPISQKFTGDARDNMEIVLGINTARKSYAERLGLDFIDLNNGVKDWFTYNADGYKWGVLQNDELHLKDDGKAFISSFVSQYIYNNKVIVGRSDGSTHYINAFDSRIGGDFQANASQYLYVNNRGTNNYSYQTNNAPINQTIMTMWVWNENTDARLDYLGFNNEDVHPGSTSPSIGVESSIDGVNNTKDIISSVQQDSYYSLHNRSDETFIHGFLPYGLSKVTYNLGDSVSAFFGNFRIIPNARRNLDLNAISAPFHYRALSGGANNAIIPFNVDDVSGKYDIGGFNGDTVDVYYKGDFLSETGIILLHQKGWNGSSSGVTGDLRQALLMYRSGTNLSVYNVTWNRGQVPNVLQLVSNLGAKTWPIGGGVNSDEIRFSIYRSGSNQKIDVYSGHEQNATIIGTMTQDGSTQTTTRWAGTVGGIWQSSTIAASANIRVDQMYAKLTQV
jgi:hypothetical protein